MFFLIFKLFKLSIFRQGYKAAFVDATLWNVLTKTLGSLLNKDWDERLEDDKLIIERILILIRYLGLLSGCSLYIF